MTTTATLTDDERAFLGHLLNAHNMPVSVLESMDLQAMHAFHENDHANPLWNAGPHP